MDLADMKDLIRPGDIVRVVGLPNSQWQGFRGTVIEVGEGIDSEQRKRREYAVEFPGKDRRWFLQTHVVKSVPDKVIRFFRFEVVDRWNQLNPDDVAPLNGNRAELINLLQERYDFTIRRAQSEVENFFAEFEAKVATATNSGAKDEGVKKKAFSAPSRFVA
jgi:hypothetical protein